MSVLFSLGLTSDHNPLFRAFQPPSFPHLIFLFSFISPFVYMAFNILFSARRAIFVPVIQSGRLSWTIRTVFGSGKRVQMAFPLVDVDVDHLF